MSRRPRTEAFPPTILVPGPAFFFAPMVEWGELFSKSSELEKAGQEVLAQAGDFLGAWAAFDTSVSLWPTAEIELRQGARVIHSSNRLEPNPGRLRLTSPQEASRRPSPAPRPFGRLAKKPRSPGGVSLFGNGTAAPIDGPRSSRTQSPSAMRPPCVPPVGIVVLVRLDMADFDLMGRPAGEREHACRWRCPDAPGGGRGWSADPSPRRPAMMQMNTEEGGHRDRRTA